MKYTLDSIKLQIAALEQKFVGKNFDYKPIFITDLSDFTFPVENQYYYGILTHGASTFTCDVFFNNNLSITIDENSQIEVLFTDLFNPKDGLAQSKYRGQFIGFHIFEKK
jgi:hypothetical protein